MSYNWQLEDWPHFKYDLADLEDLLYDFAERVGHIGGVMLGLSDEVKSETIIDIMVSEAIKTSEIEGEYLSRHDVKSSIRNNLGLNAQPELVADKRAEGIARLMVDVRKSWQETLTDKGLFMWHEMVMLDNQRINKGVWRTHTEPMQVVSGAIGKEKIHFEAPPSDLVPIEMTHFIDWFNQGQKSEKDIKQAVVRAGIAHLYFESIHPFEDGNGRIGRAIAEKALSQGIGRPVLFSLSKTMEANKQDYYEALQQAQQSNQITNWLTYFVKTTLMAQQQAEEQIEFALKQTKFFQRFGGQLNERQLKAVRRMLDEGSAGFEGGMSAKKYIAITKTSKATATRDLQMLAEMGAMQAVGGGRSTRYLLRFE